MEDIIKSHDFEKNLKNLKKFSETVPKEINIKQTEEKGILPLFNHKVTGKELNEVTKVIQEKLITQNKHIIRTIREFKTVYDTFEKLDKDYIESIIAAVESAKEASDQALTSAKIAEGSTKALQLLVNKLQEKRKILGVDGNLDAVNKKLVRRINLLTVLSILSIILSIGLSIFIFFK